MDAITLSAYAKINLTLDVTGRRPDGYHTVRMVMQSVGLHDDVTVTRTGTGGVTLACDKPFVPTDGRNLAVRAAEHFFACTGLSCDGLHIALKKRIPVAAGLAGGSTDAAAVLRALDTLYGAGLSTDALCKPGFSVSTAAVYAQMNGGDLPERPDTAGVLRALQAGDYAGVCHRLYNVMERVTARAHAEIGQIKDVLLACGADGAAMSGSGPTTFGLFRSEDKARKAYAALRRDFPDTHLTRMQPGWGR